MIRYKITNPFSGISLNFTPWNLSSNDISYTLAMAAYIATFWRIQYINKYSAIAAGVPRLGGYLAPQNFSELKF